MRAYEITLSKHPEHGFGTWWKVSRVRESHADWFAGSYSGYAFTTWGARRAAGRLVRKLQKGSTSETYSVGGDA